VVHIDNVSKLYRLYGHPWQQLAHRAGFPAHPREFTALYPVTCRVRRGEFLGIIGPNGSGKSTLLQIIAGVLTPTTGSVTCNGRVAALLELAAGFNPEFTGRENVRVNGEILGLTRRDIEERMPAIEAFASIGEYLDRPVKEYSSGMYVRLAFSSAIHVEPEILLVDEALAVGDAIFANRCIRKFEELRARGVTVIFVSHDLGVVKRLCDRAMLLWNGRVEATGEPPAVVNRYVGMVLERQPADTVQDQTPASHRHGDATSRIQRVELLTQDGEPTRLLHSGVTCRIEMEAAFSRACDRPQVGILIRNRLGLEVFGTNTRVESLELGSFAPGGILRLRFDLTCALAAGEYTLTVATQHSDGSSQDWLDDAIAFTVLNPRLLAGVADLPVTVRRM
jgi:lipopolysaccharide transport system ATP-binding protein